MNTPTLVASICAVFCDSNAWGKTWEPVKGAEELSALFSGTVLTTELTNGNIAVARYNEDGTGELKAWNDTFKREWESRSR